MLKWNAIFRYILNAIFRYILLEWFLCLQKCKQQRSPTDLATMVIPHGVIPLEVIPPEAKEKGNNA